MHLSSPKRKDYPVAVVFSEHHDQYEETAKEWTKKYATKEETPDEQLVGVSLMVYGIGL